MAICRSLAVILVVASLAVAAQAAGGIKGQAAQSSQVVAAIKGPRQQRPALVAAPVLVAAPQVQQVAVKGPGQVVPVFSAARVQPAIVAQEPVIVQQPQQQVQVQEQEPEIVQQQQQQVQEPSEIDPSAAAQDSAPAIAVPAAAAPAETEEANPRPEPYAFNYAFESGDQATSGSSQREEQQDASGRVTGFYTLRGEDGRDRRVDYIADAAGFRATISTNEMGTAPKDSADTRWAASSPTDGQLRSAESATQAARQRALLNPQPNQQQVNFAGSASSASPSKIALPKKQPVAAQSQIAQQLQEPFEQIRQTELNSRARKSRHAPFYLFTV